MNKLMNRKTRSTKNNAVPRNKFGFAHSLRTNLRYVQNQLLTATASTTAITQQMRMNSIFDPDSTGAGHQPMWRDNLSAIYLNYRVISSRIKVTFLPNPSSDAGLIGPYVVGILGSPDSTNPSTTVTDRQEQSDSVYKSITRYDTPNVLTLEYSSQSKLGIPYNDDTVATVVGASPTQQYYANVWFADLLGPATSNMYACIEVDYIVEFFKLAQQTQN